MNNLFNDKIINMLDTDGTVNYYRKIITQTEANRYLDLLLKNIPWKSDEAIGYGKHITTKRKVAWHGDLEYPYTYSNTTKRALPWTRELLDLRKKIKETIGVNFNSCLLNLYHDSSEGVTWHSDGEKSLGDNTTIASISFGAERKFTFKHKRTKQTILLVLEHGSLLVMKDNTQTNWLHSLPT